MTQSPDPLISIVVPVMNEAGNITVLSSRVAEQMTAAGLTYEILFVDDGSLDQTWNRITDLAAENSAVLGIRLSRNFGHQNALMAGLSASRGEAVISMDGDLQHPPELLPDMVAAWRQGYRIVETERSDSAEIGRLKTWTSKLFYRFFSRLSGVPIDPGTSDFRLMDRKVVDAVVQMRDPRLFVRGFAHWVGFTKVRLPYSVGNRHSGVTKYTLSNMIRFSTAATVSFSSLPLYLGIWIGVLVGLASFAELGYIVIRYLKGGTVPGWASTLTVMSLMFGTLFMLLGIIGVYIANIFEAMKQRPHFLVEDRTDDGRDTVKTREIT